MQLSSIPAKFLIPFAKNAAGSYFTEIPATTANPALASQSLGFPPLTMQPTLAGGVPPQGPDVNGAMNQIARTAWWLMAGGKYLYDSTWATNSNIGGYPAGADILDAGGTYALRSRIDSNTSNPTGSTGNWAPQTNPGYEIANPGTAITLTDVQAASSYLRVTGTVAAPCTITLQALPAGGRAPLKFLFAHDATGSTVTLTTGVGTPLVVSAGFVANVQQRNDGSLFAASVTSGGGGGGISAPALSVGAAGAAAGTISMQGSEYRSNGILRQWCTIQLNSPGTGPVTVTWTYPIAYSTVITSIRGTNLSRPAGQVLINGAEGAVLCGNLPGLTSVGLAAEGTQNTSALCWFLVEVEGY
jgi:hypothetical protein